MKKNSWLLVGAALVFSTSVAAAQTISNTPSGVSISSFGVPDSQTYGEVFTAPVTGILTSFTLNLDGGVGSLYGGVGTWNGPSTFGLGYGSPTNLYNSAYVPSVVGGPYTFAPDIPVLAGQQYVAYLSVYGDPGAVTSTSMPLSSDDVSGLDYFVWNNSSQPQENASWNYFFDAGNAQFSASFAANADGAPAPLAGAGLLSFFGLGGVAIRKRATRMLASLFGGPTLSAA